MENQITDLLSKIVPDLEKLLTDIGFWMKALLFVGPIVLVLMGLFYFFLSPKEANHKLGYRTFFGMGSVKAWQFTQKIAGMVWGGAGVISLIAAVIGTILIGSKAVSEALSTVGIILLVQAGSVVLAFLTVEILVIVFFDVGGRSRKQKRQQSEMIQARQAENPPIEEVPTIIEKVIAEPVPAEEVIDPVEAMLQALEQEAKEKAEKEAAENADSDGVEEPLAVETEPEENN